MGHKELKKLGPVILSVVAIMGLLVLLTTQFICRNTGQPQESAMLLQDKTGKNHIAIVNEKLVLFLLSTVDVEAEYTGQNAVLQNRGFKEFIPEPVCIDTKQEVWIWNRESRRIQRNLQCVSVPWYYYVDEFKPGIVIRARSQL